MTFPIPRYLHEIAGNEEEQDFRKWMAELPEVVADLARRWGLRVGDPYEPGGQCAWVAPALGGAGEELVLKVGWRHPEAEQEADGLRAWSGDGAVLLHSAQTLGRNNALLLERCVPGIPLGQSTPESEQDVIVAGLLRQLWIEPAVDHPFQLLHTMCEAWALEFEQRSAPSGIDAGIARTAMALFRELPRSAGRAVLLCTDLHAGNVIAAQREPWLAIDPKPYIGDPSYDALQHMLNCPERLVHDPMGFVQRMASLLDLDADRLRLWLFARCVHWCQHQPELYGVAVMLAP